MNIDLEIDLQQKVDVTVHVADVIGAINEVPISQRWNYCAQILNSVNLKDDLSETQKEIVVKWLKSKLQAITD